MKRKANLYSQMCDIELIKIAIHNAAIGKRKHAHVRQILKNEDKYAQRIKDMLEAGTFRPSPYVKDVVREGPSRKRREISKPKFFPDQIIHWCIYLVLKPWLFNRFYVFNCGSIPGRGVHYGKKYAEKWIRGDHKNTKYYLKMDVRKFYPSIQPLRLMPKLRRVIKDERFLLLNWNILQMSPGLPIGMLLSQVYANFFLTDLDFYIKQQLGAIHYMRYMDDMVIFGASKRRLHKMRECISERLEEEGLTLKPNWQVCRLDKEPLDFMGFRFYRDHTGIRKSIMLHITRNVRKAYKKGPKTSLHLAQAILSQLGWVSHTDSYNYFCKWLKPYLRVPLLKNIIRRNAHENLQKQVNRTAAGLGQGILPGEDLQQHQCC